MSDPEATAPPVPTQKWKRIIPWIKATWVRTAVLVQTYPDRALVLFLLLFAVAIIL